MGACVTLAQLIEFLQTNSDKSSSFKQLSDHLLRIANVPVRNVSSIVIILYVDLVCAQITPCDYHVTHHRFSFGLVMLLVMW